MIDKVSVPARVLRVVLLGLWLVITLFPLYWILVTSFKDPGTIAAAHFISVRQLHRLFAEQDDTVARYVRRRRLERCRDELLRSPRSSLTSIAHRFGFADPGVFGRSFRAAYGTTPSQYRATGAC